MEEPYPQISSEIIQEGVVPSFYSLLLTQYHSMVNYLANGIIDKAEVFARSLIGLLRIDDKEREELLRELNKALDVEWVRASAKTCNEIREERNIEARIYDRKQACIIIMVESEPRMIIYHSKNYTSFNNARNEAILTVYGLQRRRLMEFISKRLAPLVLSELEYYRSIEVYEQKPSD